MVGLVTNPLVCTHPVDSLTTTPCTLEEPCGGRVIVLDEMLEGSTATPKVCRTILTSGGRGGYNSRYRNSHNSCRNRDWRGQRVERDSHSRPLDLLSHRLTGEWTCRRLGWLLGSSVNLAKGRSIPHARVAELGRAKILRHFDNF